MNFRQYLKPGQISFTLAQGGGGFFVPGIAGWAEFGPVIGDLDGGEIRKYRVDVNGIAVAPAHYRVVRNQFENGEFSSCPVPDNEIEPELIKDVRGVCALVDLHNSSVGGHFEAQCLKGISEAGIER